MAIVVVSAVATAVAFWAVFVGHKRMRARITRSLNMKLLSVVLPRDLTITPQQQQQPVKDEKDVIAVMEQFYAAVAAMRFSGPEFFRLFKPRQSVVFELAVPHVGESITFFVAIQSKFLNDLEKQIYSYFPKAQVTLVEDYTIFNPAGSSLGAYLKLQKMDALPMRTYKELDADPLKEIINSLSKLNEVGEGAALQIIIRPSKGDTRKEGLKLMKEIKRGETLHEAKKNIGNIGLRVIREMAKPAKKPGEAPPERRGGDEEAIKVLEAKASKPQVEVNLRLVASANTEVRAEEILRQIENSFSQLAHPVWNGFRVVRPKGKSLRNFFFDFSYRLFNEAEKNILSVEELSGIYHFPNTNLESPRLRAVSARVSEPPQDLPKDGLLIGKNVYRGDERPIKISGEDRRRHVYLIGQTGVGKSTLMKNMIVQDIRNGEGVGLIDPHGDIAEEVMGLIPENRYEDVVLLDPADLSRPIGLNMLQYDPRYPEQKTFIVNELINILDKLYDLKTTGGPMFEQYTRNALLLLMEHPERGFTLLEIPKVLADKEFRRSLLLNCNNILVKDFWEKEAEKAGGEAALANMVPYITSKFNVFLANDYVRPIIAQSKTSIDFRDIMDSKKILIVSLSKGRLGDINASLLGLIVVGKILMAAFSRVDQAENLRKDFYLYIDEFQNFATDSISTILSEARKYHLDLIIAHQFIEQLKKEIRDAVFGNVGNILAMRVGAQDAEFLVKQFTPVFNESDLVNIDNFKAYVRLLVYGKTTRPFSMSIYPPEKGNTGIAAGLRRISSLKYGRDRAIVEKEIMERLRPEYKNSVA